MAAHRPANISWLTEAKARSTRRQTQPARRADSQPRRMRGTQAIGRSEENRRCGDHKGEGNIARIQLEGARAQLQQNIAGSGDEVDVVDDVDRCVPDTIIDTFEAIRLFLHVPKTAFVIAADQRIVQGAIEDRYPTARPGTIRTTATPYHPNTTTVAVP
jgi:hypothetical protein